MNIRKDINDAFEKVRNGESLDDLIPKKVVINKYIFIDLDNTSYEELGKEITLDGSVQINFYADQMHSTMFKKIDNRLKKNKATVKKIVSEVKPNASDFKIVCDIATVLADPATEFVYVVSKDACYDDILDHLRDKYHCKVKAIEKYSSLEECIRDMNFMSCETKDEIKRELLNKLFRPYRIKQGEQLLSLLEA